MFRHMAQSENDDVTHLIDTSARCGRLRRIRSLSNVVSFFPAFLILRFLHLSRNRSEMNEKPKTKSRLKSQPRRKELRSTIRTPAHPFKQINTERNPSKCQQILHTITTNTAPEEKSHLPLSRDLWALKLSNYQNPVYL
jgi:hypothetical protein